MSNEIAPIIPKDYDSAMRMAKAILVSGLATKLKTEPQVFIAMQLGACVGLSPMQAVQSISVINGKPTLGADAMLAIVKAKGQLEYIKETIEGDGKAAKAICKVKRRGEEPFEATFSAADAEKAGLWGKQGTWTQYPTRMLAMRARSFALRDVFPDILLGLHHTTEEMRDVSDNEPQDVTPEVDEPEVNNSTWRFMDDNDTMTDKLSTQDAYEYVLNMIRNMETDEDLSQYEIWKGRNSMTLGLYSKENPGYAQQLGFELKKAKDKLLKLTIEEPNE